MMAEDRDPAPKNQSPTLPSNTLRPHTLSLSELWVHSGGEVPKTRILKFLVSPAIKKSTLWGFPHLPWPQDLPSVKSPLTAHWFHVPDTNFGTMLSNHLDLLAPWWGLLTLRLRTEVNTEMLQQFCFNDNLLFAHRNSTPRGLCQEISKIV